MKLPLDFYRREDVVTIAKELLGKQLFTNIDGKISSGIIVETEAYRGPEDKASHAWNNRFTERTRIMYEAGGVAYVYLCYGLHHLFNVVTNIEGVPHAVLIRAIEPVDGVEHILHRRNMINLNHRIAAGPGSLAKAMGIMTKQSGMSLLGDTIWIEEVGEKLINEEIIVGPRVGVNYAGEDASLPWRFMVKGNRYVSKAK